VIWLGDRRGYLSDWITQQWVRFTGRRVHMTEHAWLDGPVGNTRCIGKQFFLDYAKENGLEVVRSGCRGLIPDFRDLAIGLTTVEIPIKDFYERTSEYELDAWSEWCGMFKLFGTALAVLFSRRLQQLNVPLSALDTSQGITSEVVQLRDPKSGSIVQTAWIRELVGSKNVLYAGGYAICIVPGHPSPCVKVVFPLPNGSAIVIMKPEVHPDGSFSVLSHGRHFGAPGFYFVVHGEKGAVWARYVRSLQEGIRVYVGKSGVVRADHDLRIWGMEFLRLHYRLQKKAGSQRTDADDSSVVTQTARVGAFAAVPGPIGRVTDI
jgi:hypothetical protein